MRIDRQQKILEIIRNNDIDTQERLAEKLNNSGFIVTQATVSRDIRELGLVKTLRNGKSCYSESQRRDKVENERYKKILKETVLAITPAENLIVIKTLAGCANAACEAVDSLNIQEIVGTLAGDNNLLVIVDSKSNVKSVMESFKAATE